MENKETRDKVLQAGKQRRLSVKDVSERFPERHHPTPVYINEHLTPARKNLLSEVLKKKREKKRRNMFGQKMATYFTNMVTTRKP